MLETAVIQLGEISLGISQIYEILPDVLCELQEQRLETARMTHLIESSMLEEISSPDPGTTRLPQLSCETILASMSASGDLQRQIMQCETRWSHARTKNQEPRLCTRPLTYLRQM